MTRKSLLEPSRPAGVITGPWPDGNSPDRLYAVQLPPGRYLVAFVAARSTKRFKRDLWEVLFRVIDVVDVAPEHLDQARRAIDSVLVRIVNRPKNSRYPSLQSSYAMDFRTIVRLIPPSHLFRIKPEDVYGSCTLVAVVRSVERDSRKREVPEGARYSIIDHFESRKDGCPPYAQHRAADPR